MNDAQSDDPQLSVSRMTTAQFKAEITSKGWLMKEVAKRWQLGVVRMSQICSDEKRALYYDDAVRALPNRNCN